MSGQETLPKLGHVTDLREQWLVRTDGVLAHRLQDNEISSHLCENRYRNQQIREDFPVALNEQRGIEHEAQLKVRAQMRQAEIDAEIARELAEINIRRQRRLQTSELSRPSINSQTDNNATLTDVDAADLGLSPSELQEIRERLEQEEKDARLARELSNEVDDNDALLADMKYAVEAQDSELARLLQEREYKKLQRAKEKAKQKALLKKQQRLAAQQMQNQTTLCDAYSDPRDMIRSSDLRLTKSVDSDLNYVEPFEKEQIQSKSSAIQQKEISNQFYLPGTSNGHIPVTSARYAVDKNSNNYINNQPHRQPPPPPIVSKKPRFPDPVSIRPASHYPNDQVSNNLNIINNNPQHNAVLSSINSNQIANGQSEISYFCNDTNGYDREDLPKRLSVVSDITPEALAKKKKKLESSKKKGCKIQ